MSETHLNYTSKPINRMALVKALILPRAGFNADVGLPNLQSHWHGASANADELSNYFETLEIKPTDFLPISYPHVMAGTMHMNMLTHQLFPIRLLGALHLKDRIVQFRQIDTTEIVDIDAKLGGYRLIDKGVEFDLVTNVTVQGALVWQETSIYLARGKFGGKENPSPNKSFELESLTDPKVISEWYIPKSRGREYAKISGDYNPIHLSPWLAKLFGFQRDIAHGFGIMAQAIDFSDALADISDGTAVQVDVVFKGPIFLESNVTLRQDRARHADRYDLYCDDNSRPNLCLLTNKLDTN